MTIYYYLMIKVRQRRVTALDYKWCRTDKKVPFGIRAMVINAFRRQVRRP